LQSRIKIVDYDPHAADRDLYLRTKLALAQKEWEQMQDYADAKTEVIAEIVARAKAESEGPGAKVPS
jgi:GrpB-like predicted nucleotidyltransferase (UPF0157 family)